MKGKIFTYIFVLLLFSVSTFALSAIGSIIEPIQKQSLVVSEPRFTDLSDSEALREFERKGLDQIASDITFSRGTKIGPIDGQKATCSVWPDKVLYYPKDFPTVEDITFEAPKFYGEVVQIFEIQETGWKFLGEVVISNNEFKEAYKSYSFNIDKTKEYVFQIYNCQNIENTTCTDTDMAENNIGDYSKYGEVVFWAAKTQSTPVTIKDECIGNKLTERWCDPDNTPRTITKDCKEYGDAVCEKGRCVPKDKVGIALEETTNKKFSTKSSVALSSALVLFLILIF